MWTEFATISNNPTQNSLTPDEDRTEWNHIGEGDSNGSIKPI